MKAGAARKRRDWLHKIRMSKTDSPCHWRPWTPRAAHAKRRPMAPSFDFDNTALAAAYARDGVAHVPGALNAAWVERMRAAVDRAMTVPSNDAMEFVPPGEDGRFFGDMFMHRRDADFRALFFKTPCAEIAGRAMGAAEVRLFYDQIFAKAPATKRETPWHQDVHPPYCHFNVGALMESVCSG